MTQLAVHHWTGLFYHIWEETRPLLNLKSEYAAAFFYTSREMLPLIILFVLYVASFKVASEDSASATWNLV